MNKKLLSGALFLSLFSSPVLSLDEDAGDRENYVLNALGQVLVVKMPADNQASIYRRSSGGFDSLLMQYGSSQGPDTVNGIGSNPHMNGFGTAIWQVEWLDEGAQYESRGGIYQGTPGSVVKVATSGDVFSSETICSPEPFPLINSNNQGFFGTTVDGGVSKDICIEDGDWISNSIRGARKAIFRFTPPSTRALLLKADLFGFNSPDTVTTSNSDFVASQTTFTVTDAHLIAHGGDAVTSSGNAVVKAWLDENPDPDTTDLGANKPFEAFLYLTGGSPQLVAMTSPLAVADANGAEVSTRRFAKLDTAVTNAGGTVFFRGANTDEDFGYGGNNNGLGSYDVSLNFWTSGGGINELVAAGDNLPGGGGVFEGFTSHYDLNDSGAVAFTAGLQVNGQTCNGEDLNGYDRQDPGNSCRGVYYKPAAGNIVEVARNEQAGSGNGADSAAGFDFEELGSVAVMSSSNTVYFVAQNQDQVSGCVLDLNDDDDYAGGDAVRSGIFGWNSGVMQKLVAEGDIINSNDRVVRLFLPMPELRQHDAGNNFVVRAWIDDNDDDTCVADTEQTLRLSFVAASIGPLAPIPVLGPWFVWLLAGLVGLLGGGRLLRK